MPLFLSILLTLACGFGQNARQPVKIDGDSHKLILFSDGSVGGWGDMRDGQLGPRASIPNSSGHATAFVPISLPGKALDIAAGGRSSYILLENGTILAFGAGSSGQLGCGERCLAGSEIPIPVPGLNRVERIHSRFNAVFAVHGDGSASMWGERYIGRGESRMIVPERVVDLPAVSHISVGVGYLLARTPQGQVWMAGRLPYGRIRSDDPVQQPAEVAGLTEVVSISATGVAAALKKDGSVWVWGNNEQAQFGNGRRDVGDHSLTPVRVPGIAGAVALSGANNGRHFLALMKDGSLRAWGNSDWGQIGNGVTGRAQPTVATPRISGVKLVFAAGNHSFAVRQDGTLWIWGHGSAYQRVWPLTKGAPFPIQLRIPEGVADH